MTTHEVLVRARNLLDRDGWCQGNYTDGRRYCIVGALNVAEGGQAKHHCSRAVADALGGDEIGYLPGWNDAEGRTEEEVFALFDKAILATAPPPPDPSWSDLTEEVEATHA